MAICFLQSDPRWEHYPFSGGHMNFDGCGPSACADFIYELDDSITPVEVADYMTANGHVCEGSGVYWKGIAPTLEHYGIKCEMMNQYSVYGEKESEVELQWKRLMRSGRYYGILLVGNGNFTIGTGHFISAISLSDDDQVLIYNPGKSHGKTGIYPWSMVSGQVKVFYSIEKPCLDVLFKNVRIGDSSDDGSHIGCAGILNGRIILDGVCENTEARKVISGISDCGEQLALCTFFTDCNSHTDRVMYMYNQNGEMSEEISEIAKSAKKGSIMHNCNADIVLIAPHKPEDKADSNNSYSSDKEICASIRQVYVKGELVYDNQ